MKKLIEKLLHQWEWKPKSSYNFTLPDDATNTPLAPEEEKKQKTAIYTSLDVNLEYIKTKFNTMINSDIVIREFTLSARNRQYKAFLLFIDGMVDSKLINDFILNPLMLRNNANSYQGTQDRIISEAVTNNITVRRVKHFNIIEYISQCLLPQNNIKQNSTFEEIISGVNAGNCALFIDTLSIAFQIEVKGFQQRSVDKPNNEIVIKGPHEAFVENIRINSSLLRRIINNESLIIENVEIGEITQTKCALCYVKEIANDDLVAEVRFRLNNISVDSLLSSGQLEQLIINDNQIGVPEVITTERPDKATKYLLQGRVVVLVNGAPYAMIMPATLIDFMSSPEDTNLKPYFGNFLRCIRFIAAFFTLLLPGLYVAVTSFHQEILPTELLFSILGARENVPFPIIFEILIMEISFELIREAGLRVPSPIGPTIRYCRCFGVRTSSCRRRYC